MNEYSNRYRLTLGNRLQRLEFLLGLSLVVVHRIFFATEMSSLLIFVLVLAVISGAAAGDDVCNYKAQEDQCSFVRNDTDCQGNMFNYLEAYVCHGEPVWLIILYVIWMFIMSFLLGTTADSHFCPALQEMGDRLHMSHQLAGVTLL